MTAATSRPRLWAAAAAIHQATLAGDKPGLSWRARRRRARPEPAWAFEDLQAAPAWALRPVPALQGLACLAAAAALAPALRRTVDGALLRQTAAAIGEPALTLLIETPGPDPDPPSPDLAPGASLEPLGAAVLLAAVAGDGALGAWLAARLDASPAAADSAACQAQAALALALSIERRLGASA
jgi:hypothetical protein